MDVRITASELARRVGDVLGRVRYRGDSFTVLRNGEPVARGRARPVDLGGLHTRRGPGLARRGRP